MRSLPLACALAAAAAVSGCGVTDGSYYFIPGTGALPSCSEPPVRDLSGAYFDRGAVTILSEGCDAMAGETFASCALDWRITANGNEVELIVDDEYRIEGRACGSALHLRGGFWLPVEDAIEGCTYDEDSAEEVGIEAEGNTLAIGSEGLSGTLRVRGRCTADYAMTLSRR